MSINMFDLTGKVALVTGGNSGIGMGMALGLASAGADIVVVSNTMEPSGSEVELKVTALGRKFKGYQADFSDRAQIYAFVEQLYKDFPRIDILFNNAGIIMRKPAAEHPDEYWDKVISINLDAQFVLGREVGRRMVEQGSGKMVFTCSLLSFQGGINVPGYAASKGAVASLLKAFANEWAGKGVNVNGIAPGYIATANTQALREDEERSKAILDRIPANRWGYPEDFAGPAVFLASKAGDYVSGHVLVVDGGWMGR
jgi:2-dehydro-3-deoxy-D-gluconate 5-dehydrogenase